MQSLFKSEARARFRQSSSVSEGFYAHDLSFYTHLVLMGNRRAPTGGCEIQKSVLTDSANSN